MAEEDYNRAGKMKEDEEENLQDMQEKTPPRKHEFFKGYYPDPNPGKTSPYATRPTMTEVMATRKDFIM